MKDTRSEAEIEAYAHKLVGTHGGSVTTKKIRGSVRFYLQWRENGVQKNKYLKPREVEVVRRLVSLPDKVAFQGGDAREVAFETNVFLGTNLKTLSNPVAGWKTRDEFPRILDFVRSSQGDRVLLVYGCSSCSASKKLLCTEYKYKGDECFFHSFLFLWIND